MSASVSSSLRVCEEEKPARNPGRLCRFAWWGRPFPSAGKWSVDCGLHQAQRLKLFGRNDGGFRTMLVVFHVILCAVVPICLLFPQVLGDELRRLEEWGVVIVVSLAWLVVRLMARPVPQLAYRSCYFAYRYLFATVPGRFGDTIDVAGYLLIYIAQLALRFVCLLLFFPLFWVYELMAGEVFVEPFSLQIHFVLALFAAGAARVILVFLCLFVRRQARRAGRDLAIRQSNHRQFRNLEVRRSLVLWPWMDRTECCRTPARDPANRLTWRGLKSILGAYAFRENAKEPTV